MYANLRPREQFPSLQALAYAERRGDPRGGLRYPTTLVAPLAGNEALGGLDVATQPVNLRAAILARDTDQPVMSMPFRLIQPDGRTGTIDGVTIRLPVFAPGAPPRDVAERRAREAGTIAVSFRVRRLIADALPAEAREQLATQRAGGAIASEPERMRSAGTDAYQRGSMYRRNRMPGTAPPLMTRLARNSTRPGGRFSGKLTCSISAGTHMGRHWSRLTRTAPSGSTVAVNSVSTGRP